MNTTENSAQRLYSILREAKRIDRNTTIKDVWAKVLNADAAKLHTIYSRLSRVAETFDEVESQVLSLEVNHALYLRHFTSLREVTAPEALGQGWGPSRDAITEQALESLEHCANLLTGSYSDKTVPENDLSALAADIAQLLEAILVSDLPAAAKQILADLTRSLQEALTEYRIRGPRGMRRAMFDIVARFEQHSAVISKEKQSPIVVRLRTIIERWDTLTSVAVNTSQLMTVLPPLIGWVN